VARYCHSVFHNIEFNDVFLSRSFHVISYCGIGQSKLVKSYVEGFHLVGFSDYDVHGVLLVG